MIQLNSICRYSDRPKTCPVGLTRHFWYCYSGCHLNVAEESHSCQLRNSIEEVSFTVPTACINIFVELDLFVDIIHASINVKFE